MPGFVETELSGWGRYPRSRARVYRPEQEHALGEILRAAEQEGYLARGLGRSYGDAALNSERGVILTRRMNRFIDFDTATGELTAEAGVSLADILQVALPRGWFPPVTPGTKWVTLGGAVAADIHGKNHHRDGSLSRFVTSLDLITADGEKLVCSPGENRELFEATCGGMGLTGLIATVTLQLARVETSYLSVHYRRTADLEETVGLLAEEDKQYRYSVAWLDALARGRSLGRSILMRGDHATPDELPVGLRTRPRRLPPFRSFSVPFDLPPFVLNRWTVGAFNSLYARTASSTGRRAIVDCERFFFPLDAIGHWNRLYGKRGFLQYQLVLPSRAGRRGLAEILEQVREHRIPVFLAVLKRFGEGGGLLSFPLPGYTLTLDIPMQGRATLASLRQIDRSVVRLGGRVYLAKDACLTSDIIPDMYPELGRWQEIRNSVDPQRLLCSDLSRRLKLVRK